MTVVGAPDFVDPRQPQGAIDLLGNGVIASGSTSSGPVTLAIEVGIYVRYWVRVNLSTVAHLVSVSMTNALTGMSSFGSQYQIGNGPAYFALHALGQIGSQNVIDVTLDSAAGGIGVTWAVWGMREFPEDWSTNGRQPCQRTENAVWLPANGNTVIVAAPSGFGRYLVGGATLPLITMAAGSMFSRLYGVVNGVNTFLGTCGVGVGTSAGGYVDLGSGVLLDPATPISQAGSAAPGATVGGSVYYDLVT